MLQLISCASCLQVFLARKCLSCGRHLVNFRRCVFTVMGHDESTKNRHDLFPVCLAFCATLAPEIYLPMTACLGFCVLRVFFFWWWGPGIEGRRVRYKRWRGSFAWAVHSCMQPDDVQFKYDVLESIAAKCIIVPASLLSAQEWSQQHGAVWKEMLTVFFCDGYCNI